MIRRWIEKKAALTGPLPSFVKTGDALGFMAEKGIGPLLRGILTRWRFKTCGNPFFLGAGVTLYFPNYMEVGKNVFIGSHCMVHALSEKGVHLGNNVRIRDFTWILATSRLDQPGVGLTVGEDTYIGPYCYLGAGGGLTIGKGVLVGAYVQFLAENHKFNDSSKFIREQGVSRKGIKIGDDVWIGNHTVILDGIEVGSGSIIGAGSVVTHDIPANSVVVGNPARVIRERT